MRNFGANNYIMKDLIKNTIITLCMALLFAANARAQDTIYCKNKTRFPSKVEEIGLTEIKYKHFNNQQGPLIVIRKAEVTKIRFENGLVTELNPDKYSAHQEAAIIDKTQCIKTEILSPITGDVVMGYERMLKVGTNLELKMGLIGFGLGRLAELARGSFVKGGVKFLAGQDFVVEGLRYAHPLKGKYIKPEFILSTFRDYDNLDERTTAMALNMVFGKQYILGNILTLDIYTGLGFGWVHTKDRNSYYYDGFVAEPYYYSHLYFGRDFPLAISGGMTLGLIF